MGESSIYNERIVEALEACRPGSNDLAERDMAPLAAQMAADPHLADLYERAQCLDSRLSVAFHDVPVPEGLDARILARLAMEKPQRPVSRRWLLAGSALLAVAAGLLVAVWLGPQSGEKVTEQYVLDEAIRCFEGAATESGQFVAEKSPPAAYPFSRAVVNLRGTRWRTVEDLLGRRGVAYDLPGPGDTRATLYVLSSPVEGLDIGPSLRPFTTAGCSASAWQENGRLYVLVVQGEPSTYQRYLNLPSGPIA